MSFTINNSFVEAFGSTVFTLAQQQMSRLRSRCTVDTSVVGKSAHYDRVGSVTMQQITDRHGDSPLISTPHSRRRLDIAEFEWGDLIDKVDIVKTLISPTNAYTRVGAMAAGRRIDQTCIDALTGDAIDEDGNAVTFDSNQTIAVDFVENGAAANSNMTVGKLRESKRLFMSNEVPDNEPLTMILGSSQITALMRDDEVTSADFSSLNALMAGSIAGMDYMGFHMVHSELLGISGNNRSALAFSMRGLQLGFTIDVQSEIAPRPDKRFSTYVYFRVGLGAVRMDEVEVVEVLCDETA